MLWALNRIEGVQQRLRRPRVGVSYFLYLLESQPITKKAKGQSCLFLSEMTVHAPGNQENTIFLFD